MKTSQQIVIYATALGRLVIKLRSKASLKKLARFRYVNDKEEMIGEHTALYVALEELYEFFTAETKEERLAEAIQNIAYWMRIYETEAAK